MGKQVKSLTLLLILSLILASPASGARIKDIATILGIRPNQLIGYGLVIGLDGTGDRQQVLFTLQSIVNVMERMGMHISAEGLRVQNVASVMVTAQLPPFARTGTKMDVMVSSLGDAESLLGGTLLLTPLKGADGQTYALAQGPVSVGGFSAGGAAGGGVQKNHPTVGRIVGGATVEREIAFSLEDKEKLTLSLSNPDFTTALRMTQTINTALGGDYIRPVDAGTLELEVPEVYGDRVVALVAALENLEVIPDAAAKVVLDEKTGTVVIGENVRLSTVAIAHGNLSIQVKERHEVSQPGPFSGGETVVTPDTEVTVEEETDKLVIVEPGVSIGEMVRALNAIGVTPRDLIIIFQAIKAAGALQAELEII